MLTHPHPPCPPCSPVQAVNNPLNVGSLQRRVYHDSKVQLEFGGPDFHLWQVVRASTSAPTYFPREWHMACPICLLPSERGTYTPTNSISVIQCISAQPTPDRHLDTFANTWTQQ